jgi:hypothetical protein
LKKPLMSPHPAAGLCFFAAPPPTLPPRFDMPYGRIQKKCSKRNLFGDLQFGAVVNNSFLGQGNRPFFWSAVTKPSNGGRRGHISSARNEGVLRASDAFARHARRPAPPCRCAPRR